MLQAGPARDSPRGFARDPFPARGAERKDRWADKTVYWHLECAQSQHDRQRSAHNDALHTTHAMPTRV